jgi:hypothetical protein
LTSLLGAAIGELAPEPTDPLYFYIADWLNHYRATLDPFFVRFADIWSYYFFSAIWYLFLIALVIQFGVRKKLLRGFLVALTVAVVCYVAAYWIEGTPVLPMTYETGMGIILGSVFAFFALVGFIAWRLTRMHAKIEFR